ncbi:MAG: hypothetical protein EBR82_63150, partial [Caulobacteraceae bacterium]|nr:hypothetical protein [Caulobacteraceae bacterium]
AANEAQAEYNTSLIAHVNRLKNAWEEFMHTLTSSDELKSIIDFLEKMVGLLTKVVDSRGLVGLILEVVSAILILKLNLSKLQTSLKETGVAGETTAVKMGLSWTKTQAQVQAATLKMSIAFKSLLVSLKSIAAQLLMVNGIFGIFAAVTDKNTSSVEKWNKSLFSIGQIGLGLAMQAIGLPPPLGLPLMIAGLAMAGIGFGGGLLTMGAANQAKKTRESNVLVEAQLDKQTSKYAENRSSIKENVGVVEELNDKINLTEEQSSKLNQARENLKNAMPDLVEYEDEFGNKIQRTTEQIKDQIAQNEKLLRTREQLKASDPEIVKQTQADLEAAKTVVDNFVAGLTDTQKVALGLFKGDKAEEASYSKVTIQQLTNMNKHFKSQQAALFKEDDKSYKNLQNDIDKNNKTIADLQRKIDLLEGRSTTLTPEEQATAETYKGLTANQKEAEKVEIRRRLAADTNLAPGIEDIDRYTNLVSGMGYSPDDLNKGLIDSIKGVAAAQDLANQKRKEYTELAIDGSTTEQSLLEKQKEVEFEMYRAQLLKIAASKDTSEEEKKRINDALDLNQTYTKESLKTFQDLLANVHGNTQEFSASLSAVSEIYYANLSNMFSKFSEVQQKAEIDSLLEKLGLPESFIEDTRKKGYSLVEIYVKLFRTLNELTEAQKKTSSVLFSDPSAAAYAAREYEKQFPNLKFSIYPIGLSWGIMSEASPDFTPKQDLKRTFTKPTVFGQEFVDLDQKTDAL